MTVKQLVEIVDGSLTPSTKKLDATLVQVSPKLSNALKVNEDGLFVEGNLANYYTKDEVDLAISSAGLEGQDIDTSLLASKASVDTLKERVDVEVPALIDTKVNTAVSNLVGNAPAALDTIKEIADWIDKDGKDTANLIQTVSGKLDKTTHEAFVVSNQEALDTKVEKEDGKGLSTNNFSDEHKTYLESLKNPTTGVAKQIADVNAKADTKQAEVTRENLGVSTTPVVNSIPFYTLSNNGTYVLCTPDVWLNVNGFLVPAYHATTVKGA